MVDVSKLNAPECKEAQKNMGAASTAFRDGMGSGVLPSAEDMGKLNAAKTAVTNACGGLDYGCTQMLNQLSAGQIAGTASVNEAFKPMINACTTPGSARPQRSARAPRPDQD